MHKDPPIVNLLGIPPIQIGREPLLVWAYGFVVSGCRRCLISALLPSWVAKW